MGCRNLAKSTRSNQGSLDSTHAHQPSITLHLPTGKGIVWGSSCYAYISNPLSGGNLPDCLRECVGSVWEVAHATTLTPEMGLGCYKTRVLADCACCSGLTAWMAHLRCCLGLGWCGAHNPRQYHSTPQAAGPLQTFGALCFACPPMTIAHHGSNFGWMGVGDWVWWLGGAGCFKL